ncbi:hypothetical protein [Burkholderia vietnamiensis]|uniref:hypothetical protein n=1 Tax=Burkholderia vietnamiensis TaxID=60552 RepID=UPI001D156539|nr:hypothetical protein [Burkholderia vietnamiensis]UEC01677.1 hypothetical protein LK462_06525 [Burkholderia vietnamiensis]
MSRHIARLHHAGSPILVIAGYDRPLRSLFLHVMRVDSDKPDQGQELIYDSLREPRLDWTDINTVADRLTALGIEVPGSMIEQIYLDQCFNVGNRVVEHHADQPPTVLHAA